MRSTWHAALAGSLALSAACASLDGRESFSDVQEVVQARTGKVVRWDQGTKADEEAAEALSALLAQPLTADAAVQVALLSNPALQATLERVGVAQADLVEAGLLQNPWFASTVLLVEGQAQPEFAFSVALDFLDVIYLPLRVSIAESDLEATKAAVTAEVLDLAFEARTAFYAHQAALERLDVIEDLAEAQDAALDLARRLHAAGNLSDLDLFNVEALWQDEQLALLDARAEVKRTRERVNVLLGLWGRRTEWSAVPTLPNIPDEPVPVGDVERRALTESLDLVAAKRSIEAAAARLGYSRTTRFIPELEAGFQVENEEGPWKAGPSVVVPLPLLNWGQADVARREAELRLAQKAFVAEAIRVRAAARLVETNLEAARARVLRLRDEVLPLQARIAAETLREYNAMLVGLFQLLAARRMELEAAGRYADARLDYWTARAALDQLLSGRLPPEGGLEGAGAPPTTSTRGSGRAQQGH